MTSETKQNRYPHLMLPRAEVEPERRQRPGFGFISPKPYTKHGSDVNTQISDILQQFQARATKRPRGIDPQLILRMKLEKPGAIDDEEWRRNGLIPIAEDRDGLVILMASDSQLKDFRRRLDSYKKGPPPGSKAPHSVGLDDFPKDAAVPEGLMDKVFYNSEDKKLVFKGVMSDLDRKELQKLSSNERYNKAIESLFDKSGVPPYASLFNAISEVREYLSEDRKGRLIREIEIDKTVRQAFDLELWHPGDIAQARLRAEQVRGVISQLGGRTVDDCINESVCLLRVIIDGSRVEELLELEQLAKLDLPPKPGLTTSEVSQSSIEDFLPVKKPAQNAPKVCVIDSGVASGHPLMAEAVGDAISLPSSIRMATDEHGHGTMVSGIALYGDVAECIRNHEFKPSLWLLSAKVTELVDGPLGKQMKFPDEQLISTQMRESIEYFHREYGCRIFNISLGDDRLVYDGGKPSIWAWTLDNMCRSLDVVIIVPVGNRWPVDDKVSPEDVLAEYPKYLMNKEFRLIEPATAAIPITVGSLANLETPHSTRDHGDVGLKALAQVDSPSPFTRIGNGIGEAIKPELCEYGGNIVFDHRLKLLQRKNPDVEIVSLRHDHATGGLFTWDIGTSLAAPKVAHYAAQILATFPGASANLIRALLVSSASVPESATKVIEPLGDNACLKVCGYGKPSLPLAINSFDDRVTLFAENELLGDHFHIYEIPLPEVFRQTRGGRNISVTLAFDPPTRHTRKDYLGFSMKYWLVRGKTLREVVSIFKKTKPGEDKIEGISGTAYECSLEPGHRLRENGTLQKGTFSISNNPREEYGDTYHLVVQCARNWSDEEKQRYAVGARAI